MWAKSSMITKKEYDNGKKKKKKLNNQIRPGLVYIFLINYIELFIYLILFLASG